MLNIREHSPRAFDEIPVFENVMRRMIPKRGDFISTSYTIKPVTKAELLLLPKNKIYLLKST